MKGKRFRFVHITHKGITSKWGWKYKSKSENVIVIKVPGEMQLVVKSEYVYTDSMEVNQGCGVNGGTLVDHYRFDSTTPAAIKAWIIKNYYPEKEGV